MKIQKLLLSRAARVGAFAILVAVLFQYPQSIAHSGAPGIPTPPASLLRNAPAAQGGPSVTFLPFIARNSDLTFSQVKIIQGTSSAGPYALYVANRATTVRAFATYGGATVSGVTARIFGYDSGANLLGSFDSAQITVPSIESDMARTLNFNLPASWVQPGYSFAITLDPLNLIPDSDRSNNRYPATGTAPFNFAPVRPVEVVLVPVAYKPYGSTVTYFPSIVDASYLEWMMPKVDPIPYVTFATRPVFENFSPLSLSDNLDDPGGSGWVKLLNQIESIHDIEEPPPHTQLYYGVVNIATPHNGCNNCITGVGFLQHPTGVGWSGDPDGDLGAGKTLTHEAGHNFGREHVLCMGNEASPDPNYPYNSSGGKIGVWGLDVATGTLYDPSFYADYMSYCPYTWTSDYTYAGIKTFREQAGIAFSRASTQQVPALYVGGTVDPAGQVTLRPAYEQLAPVNLPAQGTHTLQLLGSGGNVLAAYPFTPTRIADAGNFSGFGFFVPSVAGLNGIRVVKDGRTVGEKIASAPIVPRGFATDSLSLQSDAGGTHLRWSPIAQPTAAVVYRVRLSQDGGATWQVLVLDQPNAEFTVPPGLNLAGAKVEVQASDGVHVTTHTFDVR